MAMQYKRSMNRSIVKNELADVTFVNTANRDNLIRILMDKLGNAAQDVVSVNDINIIDDNTIEFTCTTKWDDGNTWDNTKIIIDPDDERTQGTCLRGMTSIWVADARIYNDGHTEYDDITQREIDEDPNRYYFAFITNGEDSHGKYQEYYVVDTKYHLPIEKHWYPSFLF